MLIGLFLVGDYRYGFNGMESDDEISGDKNSYDFGARMYNPRVGRWLSLDAYSKKYPSTSNYAFVRNNPLIFIDPDGNTDFYFNGKYVGTDGLDNGLIGLVKSKDVKKAIKKGNYTFPLKIDQGEFNDFIVIDYNILETSNEILKKSITKGETREFGAVMKKNKKTGLFEISKKGIVPGPEVPFGSKNTGEVTQDNFKKGDITIHSHRTGMSEDGMTASSDAPSPQDESNVSDQPLQIIVGKKGTAVIREGGIIQDNRSNNGTIEFYKRDPSKSSFSLSGADADKILKHQKQKK